MSATKKELEQIDQALRNALKGVESTRAHHETAVNERQRADEDCTQALALLRRVLGVPGLVDAAIDIPAAGPTTGAGTSARPSTDTTTVVAIPNPVQGSTDAYAEMHETMPSAAVVRFPTVEESSAGARRLAEAIRAQIPTADDPRTTADGVRQSIRRRRDGG